MIDLSSYPERFLGLAADQQLRGLLILALSVLFAGCVGLQTFPIAARSGDTISVAVGSADGMNASNTTVNYYSDLDPGTAIPVPVREVVKIYPDKLSRAWLSSDSESFSKRSSHGGWLSLLVLNLPTNIPVGT